MAFNTAGSVEVTIDTFGGLCTEMAPGKVPPGVSPDNWDMTFVPGGALSRPGLQKVFSTPIDGAPAMRYAKSYTDPAGVIRNLYFDALGMLWVENLALSPGTLTSLIQSTPDAYCKSITAFGREYLAISDGRHGQEVPLQYDGTNLDRVTQDGPGSPPTVTSVSLPSVDMALSSAAPVTFAVTEVDPGDPGPGGSFVNLRWWTADSVAALAVGQGITITGCVTTPVVGASAIPLNVVNAPIAAIYTGGGGGYANLVILQVYIPAGTGYSIDAGIVATRTSGGTTLERHGNIVTAQTATPHGLLPGYQAQIAGVSAAHVGGGISSVVINNESLPGIATVTTVSAHGLIPENFVTLTGITGVGVGGAIVTIVNTGQVVTVTTTTPHGLSPGVAVTIAGVTAPAFDTTATVLNIVSPTVFTFYQVSANASSSGGTVTLNWPVPDTATPNYYQVLQAPTPTTFQVQLDYADATFGSGGVVSFAWNGTFFVLTTPTATSFTYQQYGPDATATTVGTVTPYGQASPGIHQCQVAFLTRQGYITRPSPPVKFVSNGGQYVSVSNVPIGPSNVVARILAFTGADGSYFYYIPVPAEVNGQLVSTATVTGMSTTSNS